VASFNGVTRSGEEPVEDLIDAVLAGGDERWAAIAALGESSDPRAYDALTGYAASSDWTLRAAAVAALGHRTDGSRAAGLVRVLLSDESSHVIRAACGAVATLRLTALRTNVVVLLKASDASTRSAALRAIATMWVPEDAPMVLSVYRDDRDAEVRRDAAWVLRQRADEGLWPTLISLWLGDSLPRHRTWACELAAASNAPTLREAVRPLTTDEDGHVRAAARRAVGEEDPSAT
jgi:HEAT repeat protein